MVKTITIRIYPTKEQEENIWKHIDACRFMWNFLIAFEGECYKMGIRNMGAYTLSGFLPHLKAMPKYSWLKEVSASSLQIMCMEIERRYKLFFEGKAKYPYFKSKKKGCKSYPIRKSFFRTDKLVYVEKIGNIRFKSDRKFPLGSKYVNNLKGARIYLNGTKWMLKFVVECENQVFNDLNGKMGIDLGLKELAVVSFNGEKIVVHNINKTEKMKKLEKRLKFHQRRVSRKRRNNGKGVVSNNMEKEYKIIRRLYKKMTDIRNDNLHQITSRLVNLKPQRVVMENLNVKGMLKNKYLSRSILEAKFYEFRAMMHYKCEFHGIEFVLADRFFPSTKKCSKCGNIQSLKLNDREYVCPVCGNRMDRDYNAAINLMNYST